MAFMLEADQFNKWLEASRRAISPIRLNAYDNNPVWTVDPKTHVFREAAKRSLTAGGLGSVGEKAATAIADFIVLDMFANVCTGREDPKGAIKSPSARRSGSTAEVPLTRFLLTRRRRLRGHRWLE